MHFSESWHAANEQIQQWQSDGQIRALDAYWVQQLMAHQRETDARVLLAGVLCSAYLGSGHVCVDLSSLLIKPFADSNSEQWRQLCAALELRQMSDWRTALLDSSLASEADAPNGSETPMILSGDRLYFHRYYQYECTVRDYVHRAAQLPVIPVTKEALHPLFPTPDSPVDWQKIAVAAAASQTFAVISGGPGTGKTTTVTKLLALLVEQSLQKQETLHIELAAPTGKAAARLTESIMKAKRALGLSEAVSKKIPEKAATLHRLLGSQPGRSRFRHHADNPLHLDVLLIDEASMVDLPMMAKTIAALPSHARLILLGDKDQLASVEAGGVLADLTSGIEPVRFPLPWAAYLTDVAEQDLSDYVSDSAVDICRHLTLLSRSYRFDDNSGIGCLAKAVNGGNWRDTLTVLQAGYQDLIWHQTTDISKGPEIARLARGYDRYWQAVRNREELAHLFECFGEYQILTAVRQGDFGVESLNQQLEHYFYQRGRIADPHIWYPGKAIIVTHNDADLGLFNGDIGLCMPDDALQGRLRVWFQMPDGSIRGFLPSRLNRHQTVFAMTVHKSQGSEFDQVELVLPATSSPVLTRELLYTGITRAKSRFAVSAGSDILRHCVQQKVVRFSGLQTSLWQDALS